jgi:7-carboxy-7-deazaguanine synthase
MDLKAPGSGESARNLWSNLALLTPRDQIKFVLADRGDYEWARDAIAEHDLARRCDTLMSPVHGKLQARELAEWILADRLPVRLQVQLHKVLWGGEPGR